MPVETMASDIIDAAKICENHGAEHVLVSSIIMRNKHDYMEKRRRELNIILRDMCYDLGFIFVDNENIGHEHLFNDGVHLNRDGSAVLSSNILHSLNNIF